MSTDPGPFVSRLPDDRYLVASILFELLSNLSTWVYRRVEAVQILDTASLHRRISVDFRIPKVLPSGIDVGTGVLLVTPLSFLRKDVLRRFDLRTEDGRAIPILTREQNGVLAHDILVAAAEARVGRLTAGVDEDLRAVAQESREVALKIIAGWRVAAAGDESPYSEFVGDQGFMELAETLATDFVLCADDQPEPGRRRVLKFSYESNWGRPRRRSAERFVDACGWRWMPVDFDAPQAHLAASYHLEVTSETDVDIGAARLSFVGDTRESTPVIDQPRGSRAHLYSPRPQPGLRANATVFLRARLSALPAWAFGIAMLLTLLLVAGGVALADITDHENSQVAAALILLLSTFAAAPMVQPREPRLVSALLWGVRLFVAGTILCTIVAVGILAGVGGAAKTEIWWAATGGAALFTIGLAWTLLRAAWTPKAKPAVVDDAR